MPSFEPADLAMMELALEEARAAAAMGEVPVGAVVVCDGRVIARGRNRRESDRNALAHAELIALDAACRALEGWRLHRCDLYVTLEPCPMCAGAIINARVRRVVYGASDPKAGCLGTLADFTQIPFNHKPLVTAGVMETACGALLKDFFRSLRQSGGTEKPREETP